MKIAFEQQCTHNVRGYAFLKKEGNVIMGSMLIDRNTAKKVESIFEHPDEIYSVYLKSGDDAIWLQGKIELYEFLRSL